MTSNINMDDESLVDIFRRNKPINDLFSKEFPDLYKEIQWFISNSINMNYSIAELSKIYYSQEAEYNEERDYKKAKAHIIYESLIPSNLVDLFSASNISNQNFDAFMHNMGIVTLVLEDESEMSRIFI
jgi:hypothetical protein